MLASSDFSAILRGSETHIGPPLGQKQFTIEIENSNKIQINFSGYPIRINFR